tara:strand:+ start:3069 stop:3614 length:546 start_codon:yes stop_codon:yes gene_type:complete
MLNPEYPKFESNSIDGLEISLSEPVTKINLRGKKKEFFTKIGKILSLILPIEANTSSSNQKFNSLWLSPDEWMVYFNDEDKDTFNNLYNEISKLNFGSIVDVSDQWICINLKGEKAFELLSSGSPFNFNKFKITKNSVTQTHLNHTDVIIHHKNINDINLFVRRSFSEDLWLWIKDSSSFI